MSKGQPWPSSGLKLRRMAPDVGAGISVSVRARARSHDFLYHTPEVPLT